MRGGKPKLEYLQLPEYAYIWDERDNRFYLGYRRDYNRQKTVEFVKGVTFNADVTTYTSEEYHSVAYREFKLLVNLDVNNTPTDIVINVQFSDDRATWYKYMNGPFGDLRWEDGAGDKKEAISGPILAPWMRLYLVATGTSAANTFKMTVKAILNT